MSTVPAGQIEDAQQLVGDAYIECFRVDLYTGSSLFLKSGHTETWNGNIWEGIALKLSGVGQYGDSQVSRPKFQIQNPDGSFSPFASEGAFDGAFVTRYRVLYEDLKNNLPIYSSQVWQVGRVSTLTRVSLEVELRSFGDSPVFILPAGTYSPPTFPVVSVR